MAAGSVYNWNDNQFSVGIPGLLRRNFDNLADVRRGQPTTGDTGALHRNNFYSATFSKMVLLPDNIYSIAIYVRNNIYGEHR